MVLVIADGRMRRIRLPSGVESGSITAISTADDGAAFALSASRVLRFDRASTAPRVESLPGAANAIALSPAGGLWAAGRFGVFRYDADGFHEFPSDIAERDPALEALCFDAQGNLWVAARGGRVYRYDGGVWMRVAESGEIGGTVGRLMADGNGGVWAVVFGEGEARVARYFGGIWTRYGKESFDNATLVAAGVAPDGAVVVASRKRLWVFRSGQSSWRTLVEPMSEADSMKVATELSPPSRSDFACIAFDGDGVLYVGASDWVGRIEPSGFRWISTIAAFAARDVQVLHVSSGQLWAGFRRDGLAIAPVKRLW